MPYFVWQGVNTKGVKRKGQMEAETEHQVEMMLKRMRITPTKVKPAPKDLAESIKFLQPKIAVKDIMVFTRQFSVMIDAGVPLVNCLKILGDQQEKKNWKAILRDINSSVQTGSTLSESMRKYPKQFDDLFTNLVAAGEAGGILDTVLQRLAEYMEKAEKLRAKVKGAMVYPISVITVGVGVMMLMLYFVIPQFVDIFQGMAQMSLPLPTQVVVAMSNFVRSNILYIIAAGIAFGYGFKRYIKTDKGELVWHRTLLALPIFGPLLRKVAVAKFTRTLATMLTSGVPILGAMEIVAKVAGNRIIEASIWDARAAISEGRSLADPLYESGVFPSMVIQMISIGEEAGALDSMLEKVADFYDDEVDSAVSALTTLMEPMMIVFLGVGVGGMLIAMYLPMFKLALAMMGGE